MYLQQGSPPALDEPTLSSGFAETSTFALGAPNTRLRRNDGAKAAFADCVETIGAILRASARRKAAGEAGLAPTGLL